MRETAEQSRGRQETAGVLRYDGAGLAWRRIEGAGPTVIWLGGFHSEMAGTKAEALAAWAAEHGRDFLRFDYFGHGQSEGRFADGTISRWRGDALAVIDELTSGPLVLVGSSMGGWLACLAALARPERVVGLVLIAPAADFTRALLGPGLPPQAFEAIEREGVWTRPSDYDAGGYPITRALLEDGARWSILPGPVAIAAPVRILQGGDDPDVPWTHALALAQALAGPDVVFTLIRDGDHRLSRPPDIERLVVLVEELVGSA
jgi:pimeloyl-ACP methyl ester carboxylesterase